MKNFSTLTVTRVRDACLGLMSQRFKILAYHSIAPHSRDPFEVSAESFRQQMQHLFEEGYAVVSLEQAWASLQQGRIERKTVVITFDDGFKSLQTHAFPLLERYRFPATVFVPFNHLGGIDIFSYDYPRPEFEILSLAEIRGSMEKGISYGSHTMSHSDLTRLTTSRLSHELRESKRYLNEILGVRFSSLAYPFGMFDARVKQAVSDYDYACALCFGNILSNSKHTSRYEMKREKVLASTGMAEFRTLINCRNDVYRKARHHLTSANWQ